MNAAAPSRHLFPFTALTGQPLMRRALLANALCPDIGGVLLRGQKGTAKSTAVRALAKLLPSVSVVANCPWRCSPQGPLCPDCARAAARGPLPVDVVCAPLITLPLSATEDRLTGGLDTEAALRGGRRVVQPSLLAAAHQGMLYVDEINLLPDHLVDLLLDVCSSGVNKLERDGCTVGHAACFALIGSMNPEEGPLRPQLLDRFGLCVDVLAPEDPFLRLEILRRREAFDAAPVLFKAQWETAQKALADQLREGRNLLPGLRVPEALLRDIVLLVAEARCAGHRGELALLRTARALAALDGCTTVRGEHVQEAAVMALTHRRRMSAPSAHESKERKEAPKPGQEKQRKADGQTLHGQAQPPDIAGGDIVGRDGISHEPDLPAGTEREQIFAAGSPYQVRPLRPPMDKRLRNGSGRHSRTRTAQKSGRCVGYSARPLLQGMPPDIALEPTIRAAALRIAVHEENIRPPLRVRVRPDDWRYKRRERHMGNLIVFAVDASGSMGAASRMREVKSAVLSLLLHAYQKRDQVSLVAFRGQRGQTLLQPTGSVELASKELQDLPTGGRTPLADGLREARRVIGNALRKNPDTRPILVVISDGRANVTPSLETGSALDAALDEARRIARDARVYSLVVDVEQGGLLQFGQARQLAEVMGAGYLPVEALRASTLMGLVRSIAE